MPEKIAESRNAGSGTCASVAIDLCFAKVTLHEAKIRMGSEQDPQVTAQKLLAIFEQSAGESANILDGSSRFFSFNRSPFAEICLGWLTRSASRATRTAYARELQQFLHFIGLEPDRLEQLVRVSPLEVIAWRDALLARGLTNAAIARKITVVRSLFSYLQVRGVAGINPAHRDFVATPPVPRDGKTVGLTPLECRRLLDAPDECSPAGIRDRALFAVLAYTGCRVGELCRLRVSDYKTTSGHRVVEIRGKGGKERRVPLNPEAVERIEAWLSASDRGEEEGDAIRDKAVSALFRPARTARGRGIDGFLNRHLSERSVQLLVARFVRELGFDPCVTVHSFRVTALTTARERGCDLVSIQTFAGHVDPKTTLSYIRNRDDLKKSPAYILTY